MARNGFPGRRAIPAVLFAVLVLGSPLSASAALSSDDEALMTSSLDAIQGGWVQSAVDSANSVFAKSAYTAADWEAFFRKYFVTTNRPLTDNLWGYLWYPSFGWFDDALHLKLQTAFSNVFWEKADAITAAHPADLGAAMNADANLRQTLFNAHRFYGQIAGRGILAAAARETIDARYQALVAAYPQYFKDTATISNSTQPFVASLRAAVWPSGFETLPMTDARKAALADAVALGARKRVTWDTHGVLLIDNNGFDAGQFAALDRIFASVPSGLHNLRYMTCRDFFGIPWQRSDSGNAGMVNVAGLRVGGARENGFPSEVPAFYSDVFCLVAVHETCHVVAAYQMTATPGWKARHDAIIARTGGAPLQFLRSMFVEPDGTSVFMKAPQEFFASISNQYFGNTQRTFDLAVARFQAGYKEPMNQFLFFADTFSKGGAATKGYVLDTAGMLAVSDLGVGRDANGRLNRLSIGGRTYSFTLDADGYVTAYSTDNAAPGTPSAPSGSGGVAVGAAAPFSAVATDANGDALRYDFDWGDGTTSSAGPAASGTPVSASHAWASPGTYAVRVRATDALGAASGWSPALSVTVSAPANAPDLALSAISATVSSGKVAVKSTLKNQGSVATAGTVTVAFYLSTDPSLGSGDVLLGNRVRTSALGAGATDSATTTLAVPAGTPPGDYHVLGLADSKNAQLETDEANNGAATAARLPIRPDLIVSDLSVARSGSTLSVSSTAKNLGPLATSGSFRIDFYLTSDAIVSPGADAFLGSRTVSASLGYGQSNAATVSLAIPAGTLPGNWRVGAIADAGGGVAETNESNNAKASRDFDLKPDLVAVSVAASVSGRTVTVTETVRNDGPVATPAFGVDIRLSTDTSIGGSDPLLVQRGVPALAPGASSAAATVIVAPSSVPAGSYYVGIFADALGLVPESAEGNNKKATASKVTIGP